MKIEIISHLPKDSMKGNMITALRWEAFLKELGFEAEVRQAFSDEKVDLLIALDAVQSAGEVHRFRENNSAQPVVLVLSGMDLAVDGSEEKDALQAMEQADALVVHQPFARKELPADLQERTRVIYQSAIKPRGAVERRKRTFDVCVVSHLRESKDPFRAAEASRLLPRASKVRILHIGGVLEKGFKRRAIEEMGKNKRYSWLGQRPGWETRKIMADCKLLVISSHAEGGANVISEAVVAGVPILATRISGNMGILGEDYPGYFEVGNTEELARLLEKAEKDSAFYQTLQAFGEKIRPRFEPESEKDALASLIREMVK
ncbi:MAG: TIGR04348 family glycosyltransferase [Calditrichaeota bacterium]|nr:TIGR04348 family glycosyltransferase [Calditrichota bacterium]